MRCCCLFVQLSEEREIFSKLFRWEFVMVFNEKFNEELNEEFGEMIDSSFCWSQAELGIALMASL